MAKKHGGLYDESPTIKGEEEGKPKVVKKAAPIDGPEEKGDEANGFPIHARHAHERHQMHARHEHEHALHEHHHGIHGKEPMHTRHEHEAKEMHTRHEKEATLHSEESGAGGAEGKGDGEISKVEKKKD
jgi:hypothetical protein